MSRCLVVEMSGGRADWIFFKIRPRWQWFRGVYGPSWQWCRIKYKDEFLNTHLHKIVEFESPMPQAKFQDHKISGSREGF